MGEPGPADDRKESTCFQKSLRLTSKQKKLFSVYEFQGLDAQPQILGYALAWLF